MNQSEKKSKSPSRWGRYGFWIAAALIAVVSAAHLPLQFFPFHAESDGHRYYLCPFLQYALRRRGVAVFRACCFLRTGGIHFHPCPQSGYQRNTADSSGTDALSRGSGIGYLWSDLRLAGHQTGRDDLCPDHPGHRRIDRLQRPDAAQFFRRGTGDLRKPHVRPHHNGNRIRKTNFGLLSDCLLDHGQYRSHVSVDPNAPGTFGQCRSGQPGTGTLYRVRHPSGADPAIHPGLLFCRYRRRHCLPSTTSWSPPRPSDKFPPPMS